MARTEQRSVVGTRTDFFVHPRVGQVREKSRSPVSLAQVNTPGGY